MNHKKQNGMNNERSQEVYDAFEECRHKLNELLIDNNLDLDI